MISKKIFFLILFSSLISFAQINEVDKLLNLDFQEEIKTADFLTPEILKKYENSKLIPVIRNMDEPIKINEITGNNLFFEKGHAIHDLDTYIQNRLGKHLTQAIKNDAVNIKVFSGTENSFMKYINNYFPELLTIEKIPSLYEEWGISKYLIKKSNDKPTVIIKVPTSLRYAKHYATMIRFINEKNKSAVFYDEMSFDKESRKMKKGAENLLKIIGTHYSIVTFGYASAWTSSLEKTGWKYLNKKEATDDSSGITCELLTIENTKTGLQKTVLLLSSKKTVWGELAAMMTTPFIHNHVTQVVFMGSAGAVSDKNSVYDLSVPEKFIDQDGRILMKNNLIKKSALADSDLNIKINFGATHGNTFSPIEQNANYLKAINNLGIDTIDVEQSLLAREILNFNKMNHKDIKFGAINLITDKPYTLIAKSSSQHDLDRIDINKKKEARQNAVQFFLKSLSLEKGTLFCKMLFN